MKRGITYFLLLQLNFLLLNSQPVTFFMNDNSYRHYDNYSKGYILLKTDTIHCYIKNETLYNKNIKYRLTMESELQKISIEDIIEAYNNVFVFEKINYEHSCFLLKRLIKGPVSLYERIVSSGSMIPEETSFYLKKSDKLVEIKSKSYDEDIKSVLTGNPEIIKKVEDLMYEDIEAYIQAFVNDYNTWLKIKDKKVQ